MPNVRCSLSERWRSSDECRSLSSVSDSWLHDYLRSNGKAFDVNELMYCKSCKNRLYSIKNQSAIPTASIIEQVVTESDSMEIDVDDEKLSLKNLKYLEIKSNCCVICNLNVSSELIIMPKGVRLELLSMHRIYVPPDVRCCTCHLLNNRHLSLHIILNLNTYTKCSEKLLPHELKELCNDLLSLSDEWKSSSRLDFEDLSMTDDDYESWTGWTTQQFNNMYEHVSSFLRSSSNRTSRNAFAIFWIKLKTNLSFRQIGSLFNTVYDSELRRKRAADAFDSVRNFTG